MDKKSLLSVCRYYKDEKENPFKNNNQATFWEYEKKWIEFNHTNKDILISAVQEYINAGLADFEAEDNTPLSLKAFLFDRYSHWLGGYGLFVDAEKFKPFYMKKYKKGAH